MSVDVVIPNIVLTIILIVVPLVCCFASFVFCCLYASKMDYSANCFMAMLPKIIVVKKFFFILKIL